jgi:hypothetical protein
MQQAHCALQVGTQATELRAMLLSLLALLRDVPVLTLQLLPVVHPREQAVMLPFLPALAAKLDVYPCAQVRPTLT